jgi:Anti-sigma-K factor rskA, C-terminal/Putative zinc-finger
MSEHPYEELPSLLFGELDRPGVTRVSDHLAGCDDCRRELAVLAATSASLRATAHQVQPSSAPAPRRRRGPILGLAATLVVAVVAAAVLWAVGPLRPGGRERTVPLAGVGAVAASGRASMAGDGGDRQMTVTASGLPALAPGQFYEVWLLDPDAGTVFPVGVLPDGGRARFTLPASVVGRYQAVDVSLEADDGDPAHSKRSLLRGRYA